MSIVVTPNGTEELLECLDILMAVVDYKQESREHTDRVNAFYDYYDGLSEASDDEYMEISEEFNAAMDVLYSLSPVPAYTADELETALWQTTSLAMTLLMDHMALVDVVKDLEEARKVSEIIRPQLYVPGQ